MSSILLLAIVPFLCLVTHWYGQKSLGHPGVLHGAIWFFVFLVYAIFQPDLEVISNKTIAALMTGVVMFSIGVHIGNKLFICDFNYTPEKCYIIHLPSLIAIISLIGFIFFSYKVIKFAPVDDGLSYLDWYRLLRNNVVQQGKGSFGLAGYALNFCFAGVVYLIIFSRRVRFTWWLPICICLALGFSLFSTGRTYFLLLVCLILGAAIPIRRIKWIFFIIIAVFSAMVITWLTGRFDLGSMTGLERHFKSYSIAAVSSFDYLVNLNLSKTWGAMTFRTPLAVLKAVGLPITVPELVQVHPPTKIPSNIYTVFSPYYRDFGFFGIAFFMLLLGGLQAWIFRQVKYGSPIIILANAVLFYALFLQFAQDQYFSLMSQWIQLIVWIYVLNKIQPLPVSSDRGYR